jgi:uncharacterized protein
MSSCSIRVPSNGIYFTEKDNEGWHEYFGRLLQESGESTIPVSDLEMDVKNISIILTERCNLRCTYCYQSHEKHKNGTTMTKETARDIVDFILDDSKGNNYFNSSKNQGVILDMIGGEPLYEIEIMDYLVDYFKSKAAMMGHPWATNYMVAISTNGTLYHTDKVQRFLEKNKNRVSITFSMDGNKDLHDSCRVFPDGSGSYDRVRDNVDIWLKQTGSGSSKVTLAPENIIHTSQAIPHLWEMGIHTVYANTVYEEGWNYGHATIFYNELKKLADYLLKDKRYGLHWTSLFSETIGSQLQDTRNYCGGNGSMLAIGTDGRCYPCLRYMETSLKGNRKPFIIGNIEEGLEDPNTNIDLIELKSVDMVSQSDDKCKTCKIAQGCGVCSAYNYEIFGTANKRATFICPMHQARVMGNAYYWNKLYQIEGLDKHYDLNIPKDWALNIVSEEEYEELLKL